MKKLTILLLTFTPAMLFAQTTTDAGGLTGLLSKIAGWFGQINNLLLAAAALSFFWGLVVFIFSGDGGEDDKREKAKKMMMWSIGAIFIMVSLWGIVKIMQDTVGIKSNTDIQAIPIPGITAPQQ